MTNDKTTSSLENMESQYAEINLFDFIKYLYTHRLFIFIVTLAIPGFMGVWTFFVKKPTYKAHLDININLTASQNNAMPGVYANYYSSMEKENKISDAEQLFNSAKYREMLHQEVIGKTVLSKDLINVEKKKRIIRKFFGKKVYHPKGGSYIILNHISLQSDLEKYTITMEASSQRPEVASALVDIASYVLVKLNYKSLVEQVDFVESFLKEQAYITRKRLGGYENQLANLQKKNKIFSIDNVQEMVSRQHLGRTNRLREIQVQYETLINYASVLSGDMKVLREIMASKQQPSYLYLDQIQKRLDLLKFQKETKQLYRDVASTGVSKQIDSLIVKTKESFAKLSKDPLPVSVRPWDYYKTLEEMVNKLRQEASRKESEIKALEDDLIGNEDELVQLPDVLQEINFLKRRVDITSDLYKNLQTKLQETQIRKAGQTNDLRIYSASETPGAPTGMGVVKKYILSIVGGIALGSILLILYYMLIPTVRSRRDLEILGIRVIGEVPWYRRSSSGKILALEDKPTILIKEDPHSIEAHTIRHTRFNLEKELKLHQARNEGYGKVLTVCSIHSGEGKTFNTVNMAYSLSAAKFKTLILDIDLRKPNIGEYFGGLPEGKSLPYLNNDDRVEFMLHSYNDYIDVVDAPKIHENVCDYLEGVEFRDLIHEMKEKYDIILIDTPPIAANLEPLITTQYSDAVLFVANQRKTVLTDIRYRVDQIQKYYSGPIIGLLNFIYEDILGPNVNKVDFNEIALAEQKKKEKIS